MTQLSMFWNTNGNGDGVSSGYNRENFLLFLGRLLQPQLPAVQTSGVLFAPLEPTEGMLNASSTTDGVTTAITIEYGAAIVAGFFYYNDADVVLNVTVPPTYAAGHVILECNYAAQTVRLKVVRANDGDGTTPALVQTAGVLWQLRLYTFVILDDGNWDEWTDARTYIHMATKVNSDMLDMGAVTAEAIASGAVAFDKLGTAGLYLLSRQGGDATNWDTAGTALYTSSTKIGIEAGTAGAVIQAGGITGVITVTYPNTFTGAPLVFLTVTTDNWIGYVINATNNGFELRIRAVNGATLTAGNVVRVHWLAVGK